MELIDRLLALTKHQNTAISFLAYCILKFIRSVVEHTQQYLRQLETLLRPAPIAVV